VSKTDRLVACLFEPPGSWCNYPSGSFPPCDQGPSAPSLLWSGRLCGIGAAHGGLPSKFTRWGYEKPTW
jgi:hypothetical protein